MENITAKYGPLMYLFSQDDPTIVSRYEGAKTLEDRVATLYSALSVLSNDSNMDNIDENDVKSSEHSKAYRAKGNVEFLKSDRNLANALSCYTKSIAAAPYPVAETDDSVDLALAFANRSAVLLAMGKHDECISDITQTLKFQYPDALKYKVYMRKGECLQIMGRAKEAKQSFENAEKVLPLAAALTKEDKGNKLSQIRTHLDQIKEGCAPSSAYKPRRVRPPPKLADGVNVKVPTASSCIEIAESQEWGRYIRATRDIKPGEVLMVDTSYVYVMRANRYLEVCINCLETCNALIPCKTCRVALFCSDACRKQYYEECHEMECAVYLHQIKMGPKDIDDDDLPNASQSPVLLRDINVTVLRILIKASKRYNGLAGLYKRVQEMAVKSADGRIAGFNDEGKYESQDYETMHNLKVSIEKRNAEEVCMSTFNVALILEYLEKYGPFRSDMADATLKRFAGGMLLQYMISILTNGVTTTSPLLSRHQDIPPLLGTGIYPTFSLLNHSCFANACVYSYKSQRVLQSLLTIKKGEQESTLTSTASPTASAG